MARARGKIAGAYFSLYAVVHHDVHLSADPVDQVGPSQLSVPAIGFMLRPAPAGLPCACHRRVVADFHDLHLAL
jgi:hypothetical protein